MAVKQKVLPEGQKQAKMFGFLGIKEPEKPPVVDLKNDPEFQRGYLLPSYYDQSPDEDDVGWNDMIRWVLPVVDPDRLRFRHDAIVGYISWILVCPVCNSALEPVQSDKPVIPDPKSLGFVFQRDEKFNPVFAKCGKCDVQYFIAELVKDRSFRQKFPTDNITLTIDFLGRKG